MRGPTAAHECQRNVPACPAAAEAADVPDEPCGPGLAEVVQPAAARAAQEMLSAASGTPRRERSLLTQCGIGMETILPDRRRAAANEFWPVRSRRFTAFRPLSGAPVAPRGTP